MFNSSIHQLKSDSPDCKLTNFPDFSFCRNELNFGWMDQILIDQRES